MPHLQREVDLLKKRILGMGAIVERGLEQAVRAVLTRDDALAQQVIAGDPEIDHLEVEFEEECLKVIALYQPVAGDMRFVVALLKINNDLERIGDLAVNIAERASFMARRDPVEIPPELSRMAGKAKEMLRRALDALVNRDAMAATAVCAADDEVDALNRDVYNLAEQKIRQHPDRIPLLLRLYAVAHNLERVADHATNIAEDVIYMSEGRIIRHRMGARSEPPETV